MNRASMEAPRRSEAEGLRRGVKLTKVQGDTLLREQVQ